jgi:hypothetical protein
VTLLAAVVGGDLAPLFGFPFENRVGDAVAREPGVGACDEVKEIGVGFGLLVLGAAATSLDPGDGGAGVAVDGRVVVALLLQQREGVDDGQVFADVVGAVVVGSGGEELVAGGEVDAAVLDGSGDSAAGGVADGG